MEGDNESLELEQDVKIKRAAGKRTNGQLSKQAEKLSDDALEMARMVRDLAQEKLQALIDSAAECDDRGREKVKNIETTIEQYFIERPFKSMLIAAGVGMLFGRFWMRR
jgi:ElaB/YqjD/DUF883 family membrane-anchored ribosome-binding protein